MPNWAQYSGYIDIQSQGLTKSLFYWFVESQNNPATDPVRKHFFHLFNTCLLTYTFLGCIMDARRSRLLWITGIISRKWSF